MKSNLKNIIFFLALIMFFVFAAVWTSDLLGSAQKKTEWSDIVQLFEEEKVTGFVLDTAGNLVLTCKGDKDSTYELRYRIGLSQQIDYINDIAYEQHKAGIIKDYDYKIKETSWIVSFLPYIIIIVFAFVMYFLVISQTVGKGGKMNSFGRAKAKLGANEKHPVMFRDVAGADEEKEELQEVVEFLRDPQKFTKLGARIPRGVLLVGPPGTGKTLLAKAVAGEAGVPFYSISGSDFVEMYVGVGASRVRDLFETARKNPASIIFIDEIDAVGRHRGAGLGGGHDEREQTLNQLLVEMDGFGNHDGVIVMAATNRPDILDPALLRPGRFDRQITVNYPDLKGREDILKVHARNKPLEGDVELGRVAQTTVGFTGADLANLLNEAALLAARKNKHLIGMTEIEEATLKVMVGTEKKNMKISAEERRKTAYHEAGHAILADKLPSIDPVRRISIIPSGRALGYTLNPPVRDKYSEYKHQLTEEIAMLLGGRAAEKIIFEDVSGGASNDIMRATQIARRMVTKYGMSDLLGNIHFGSEHDENAVFLGRDFSTRSDYSEETASKIDGEIKRIVDGAYELAEKILRENIDKLHFVAEYLTKYEVMDDVQFAAAMSGDKTAEEIAAIDDVRRRRSAEENEKAAAEEREKERLAELERQMREAMANASTEDAGTDGNDSEDDNSQLPQ